MSTDVVCGMKVAHRIGCGDESVVREVLRDDTYGLRQLGLIGSPVVVDIGAHIGCFSLLAHSVLRPSLLLAYEPESENFKLLTTNIAANRVTEAKLVMAAVTGSGGGVRMSLHKGSSGCHSLATRRSDSFVDVASVAFDDVVRDVAAVDVLKIDCEGSEYSVFRAASDASIAKVMTIVMEFHEFGDLGEKAEDLFSLLRSKGFVAPVKERWLSRRRSGRCGIAVFRRPGNA
jgi:FkbM family methyltransferase